MNKEVFNISENLGFKAIVNLPYWGKLRRGEVTKFSSGDKYFTRRIIFLDDLFYLTKNFPERMCL